MTVKASVEKIYILDGGLARVEDGSIYSPGVNVGVPMTLSCNAYLIRHLDKWIMWDTGTPDSLYAMPSREEKLSPMASAALSSGRSHHSWKR